MKKAIRIANLIITALLLIPLFGSMFGSAKMQGLLQWFYEKLHPVKSEMMYLILFLLILSVFIMAIHMLREKRWSIFFEETNSPANALISFVLPLIVLLFYA